MQKSFSRISLFLFMSILLTSGFGNFMVQDAYAASAYSAYSTAVTGAVGGDSTATTNIVVTFTNPIYTTQGGQVGGAENEAAHFTVAGSTVNTANIESRANGLGCAAGTTTVTLVLAAAISTSATPAVSFNTDAAIMACNDDAVVPTSAGNTPTDGLSPTVVSAVTTSTTTIDVTFSEAIDDATDIAADFAITIPAATVASTSVAGSVVTITLTGGTAITDTDTPTVTLQNTGVDDGSGNTINSGATVSTSGFTTATASTSTSGGGSGCDDCEAPTLGIDKNGNRIVSNGFTYNGNSVDAERFFTPYPLITVNVGKTNTANFKLYENEGISNIRHFTLAFGMDKGDIISDSKAKIELDIDHEGTETITVPDPENALDNIKVTTSTVSCSDDSFLECLGISIQHRFRDSLDFNIVGTDVWDSKRNAWQNTFNHGIEVVGKSLNPAKEYDGINKGHIYHLTETGKTTAIDEFGNTWSLESGLWNMDSIYSKMILESIPMGGYTRADPEFDTYKFEQALLAENTLVN